MDALAQPTGNKQNKKITYFFYKKKKICNKKTDLLKIFTCEKHDGFEDPKFTLF